MMKTLTKCMLAAAVVSLALAGTTSMSLAKKAKAKKEVACTPWTYKTATCSGVVCGMSRCGLDGKWYPSLLLCWQPACPK
jgi:hypothetical protein